MLTYTTSDLVQAIVNNSHIPESNRTFNPTEILALADREMRTRVEPHIASTRENYWLTTTDIPINSLNEYPIPSLAQGGGLVDIKVATGSLFIPLIRLDLSEVYSDQYSTMPSYGFYIEDGIVRLMPNNALSGHARMWYYRIPSKLVPVSACAQISDIDTETGEVTVASLPVGYSTSTELDVVAANPGFNVLMKDTKPTNVAGNVLTFESLSPRLKVGDYVCLSGQSCVVQAPMEWVEVLVQAVTCRIYEIQGYDKKLATASKALKDMEDRTLGLVSPRVKDQVKVIKAGGSLLGTVPNNWNLPGTRRN